MFPLKDRERNNWRIFKPLTLPSPRRETAEKVAVAYDRLGLSPDQSTTGSRSE